VAEEELAVLRMNVLSTSRLSMKSWVFTQLEYAKILVSRLVFDRCLVEAAEVMDDALFALAWRSMNS
jgi:hypothetical protein